VKCQVLLEKVTTLKWKPPANCANKFYSEPKWLAGSRYSRTCCLALGRRYGFRADFWEGKVFFFKGSGGKTRPERNKNTAQKLQSRCFNEFSTFFGELLWVKIPQNQGWFCWCLTLKVYCTYLKNGKNDKIAEIVAMPVPKRPV